MDIRTVIDLNMLQQIQDFFSDATGLAAIAVDAKGEYITQGSNFTDFCMKYTRASQEGLRRCTKCDQECTGTYFCHAGLMDFSSDIVVNGERVGAIIGGQVLPEAPDETKFRKIARELGIQEDEYVEALKKVPIRTEKTIRAAADMLGFVVNQLVNMEYIKKLDAKKITVFDTEIVQSLKTIEQIQTMSKNLQQIAMMENILAINAAVEAAHAGSAGVGFAVVAKEIGSLSQRSGKVYGDIFDLILQIRDSVNAMGNVSI